MVMSSSTKYTKGAAPRNGKGTDVPLSHMYICIIEISLEANEATVLYFRDRKYLENRTDNWEVMMRNSRASFPYEQDWEKVWNAFSPAGLEKLITQERDTETLEFRYKPGDGPVLWVQAVMMVSSKEEKHFLMTVRNINELYMSQNIVNLFVHKNCDYFIFLDAKNRHYQMFSSKGEEIPMMPAAGEDYSQTISDFINHNVVEEDREYVLSTTDLSHVRKVLDEKGEYNISYGLFDPRCGYTRKRLQYIYYNQENELILLTRTDVTDIYLKIKEQSEQLERAMRQTQIDSLTGVYNHRAIIGIGQRKFHSMQMRGGAVLFIALDDLKLVNDMLGHKKGDQLLKFVAETINGKLGTGDFAGRVGGSEFVVLLCDYSNAGQVENLVVELDEELGENPDPLLVGNTCSIGIARFPEDAGSFDELLEKADRAVYCARVDEKKRYAFWNSQMDKKERRALGTLKTETVVQEYIPSQEEIIQKVRSQLAMKELEINWYETRDRLTGLYNRESIEAYIETLIEEGTGKFGLLMMDFDGFSIFNSAYGYLAGDMILVQFGNKLRKALSKEGGTAGRLNSELFMVVSLNATRESLEKEARKILEMVGRLNLYTTSQNQIKASLTMSIGGTIWSPEEAMEIQDLVRESSVALKKAKQDGKGRYVFFEKNHNGLHQQYEDASALSKLAQDLQGALKRGEFVPYYQPLFNVQTQKIACAEALARWRHPKKGLLTPDKFIPMFENSALIISLDLHMFEKSCKNMRKWIDADINVVPICCNFSRLHFLNRGFARELNKIASRYRISPSYLGVEITENILVEDNESIMQEIRELRNYGFAVELDDFGKGYSSFGMLQDLPLDTIKLDRIFFQRELQDYRNANIIRAIIKIAKTLGISVVCEGIETKEQVEFLKTTGCEMIQGYVYARPMDDRAFVDHLEQDRKESLEQSNNPQEAIFFIKRAFDDFYIIQNIDALLEYAEEDILWEDVLQEGEIQGMEALTRHFEGNVRNRNFTIVYRQISPHEAKNYDYISGEAMLIDNNPENPKTYSFFFRANYHQIDKKFRLTKISMQLLINHEGKHLANGNYAFSREIIPLQEEQVLDPYFGQLPFGIIRYDLSGDMLISYMNKEMYRIIGYTQEEFKDELGCNMREIVYKEDLARVYEESLKGIEDGEMEPIAYRMVRKNGEITEVLYFQCNSVGIDGRPVVQGMYLSMDWLKDEE